MLVFKRHGMKRKLLFGFKYIRFKTYNSAAPVITVKEAVKMRANQLAEILDCNNFTAREMILRNKTILKIDSKDLVRNAKFCSKYLRLSDVVEYPYLISINSSLLQHHYFSLKELGFIDPSATSVLRFSQLINKTPKDLVKEGIPFDPDFSTDSFLDFLPDSESTNKSQIRLRLKKKYEDGSHLKDIKETINVEFLASKLECSLFKAQKMCRIYPPLRMQSYLGTSQLLDVLFQKLKIPVNKVFSLPTLLSLHHEIAENFLESLPNILGISTIEIVNRIPLILRRPVGTVRKIESILKSFDISDQQLLCCPRITAFIPRTLQQRLEFLCNSEDFLLLKPYKKFLWLVYHYKNVNSRLKDLKEKDIPLSVNMFIVSKRHFEKYLEYSVCRTHITDICYYLAEVFSCKQSEVISKLEEFPNLHNSSLFNCKQVIDFLLGAGVNKRQIFNGLGVVFYDFVVVKEYFKTMQSDPRYQPFTDWSNHYNLVQLLIYTVEVDSGFRGSNLYKEIPASEETGECFLSEECVA